MKALIPLLGSPVVIWGLRMMYARYRYKHAREKRKA